MTQEIVGKSQGELSSSDRAGQPAKEGEKRVLKSHDRTGQPVEGRLHKVQEDGHLKSRDDVEKFNLAMDDENIDFNISGVPNAMVKRSQSSSVHNLIQKIESHPQKKQFRMISSSIVRSINPFSEKSKDAIMAAGNTELCEILNVEPKLQCKACLKHWSAGIVYLSRARFVLHPELLHQEGPAIRSQVWESTWMQRVPYGESTCKEMPQKV